VQFNSVVTTNERAVWLWDSFGFEVVGRLRQAFEHPTEGVRGRAGDVAGAVAPESRK
jgi:hypothetical protein